MAVRGHDGYALSVKCETDGHPAPDQIQWQRVVDACDPVTASKTGGKTLVPVVNVSPPLGREGMNHPGTMIMSSSLVHGCSIDALMVCAILARRHNQSFVIIFVCNCYSFVV